ncbi:thiol reductant ABC exporter subunit CydD [Leucobacter sp. W1153]|uniref:thiol reductant ABC exporter subunit CydD n=1 Tax=Leucobacter sp. W1153 TaxID=3439064 RepID=UPI003F3A8304
MKPLDPRLLRYARAARGVLGIGGLLGLVRTAAVMAWCWLLANAIATLVLPVLGGLGGASGRVAEGALPREALPLLIGGAAVALVVRSFATWGMEAVAARGAVRAKGQLRAAALDAIDRRSPEWLGGQADAGPTIALGRGLDALDGYFSAYLPQLILTACATPFLVLAVLLADPLSGVTVLIVFPVIPLFMILIGLATRAVQERQWQQLEHLSRSFLDVVEGLSTLKIFRREQRQFERIARETGEYRTRTMQVLRVTFLSGFVLDLAGTFSIALVAVTVGTRLVNGEFPLALGLFVLLLLPEVFIPIRQVGAAFHASTEGLAAAHAVFDIIEGSASPESDPRAASRAPSNAPERAAPFADDLDASAIESTIATVTESRIQFDGVTIMRGHRVVAGLVTFSVEPGELVTLTGPSGAGKSTLVSALLGFVAPATGVIARPGTVAWSGQRPGLLQGTIAENVALGAQTADPGLVARALKTVGLEDLDPERALGVQGAGLSGGQAQRVAIARCLYRAWWTGASALVLDEPSSALDAASEKLVCDALRSEAREGRAVLVVSHRPALIQAADRVVRLGVPA